MQRIPRPWPDESKLPDYHYLGVFDSPTGADRSHDDWQPRHNMKKKFQDGTLKLDNEDSICSFSRQFIVDKDFVKEYLQHLVELKLMRSLRTLDRHQKRRDKQTKLFDDYDWEGLIRSGQLSKLSISELEKYLNKFSLSLKGKKADKVRKITTHVFHERRDDIAPDITDKPNKDAAYDGSDVDEESDSDDDIILANHESETDSEEDESVNEQQGTDSNQSHSQTEPVPVGTSLSAHTRSGRAIAISQSRYKDSFFF